MPSLPSSIKGSIGNIAGPGNVAQLGAHPNVGGSKRQVHPGMPLNLAANDITFAGGYNQMRKFGAPGAGVGGQGSLNQGQPMGGQKLM